MSEIKCAPLVFGRTYEVDFRFLVVPEDFQVPDRADFQMANQALLERHIDATMLLAEQLAEQPRWSIFKDRTHCIFGVTCMVLDVSNEKTQDRQGRPLYVFLGYVFRSTEIQPFPMQLEAFRDLYKKYVLPSWDEKSYSIRSKSPKLATYQSLEENADGLSSAKPESLIELNYERSKIFLWPDLPEFREKLWYAASKSLKPVSICLGLPNEASALRGDFTNGTTLDSQPIKVLDRERKVPQKLDRSSSIFKEDQWDAATKACQKDERHGETRTNHEGMTPQGKSKSGQPEINPGRPISEEIGNAAKGVVKDILKAFNHHPQPERPSSDGNTYSNGDETYSDKNEKSSGNDRISQHSLPKKKPGKTSYSSKNQPTDPNPEKGIEFGFKPKGSEDAKSDSQDEWF